VSAIGVLVGAVGTFRLAQLGLGSSYLTVWPFYVLVGSGYGLAVPAIAAAAMGTVPGAYAGTGSGILSASRQVGTTLGLAVLGSISVAAVSRAWDDRIGGVPPAIRDEAGSLVQRVAAARAGRSANSWGPRQPARRSRRSSPACTPRCGSLRPPCSRPLWSPSSACARIERRRARPRLARP